MSYWIYDVCSTGLTFRNSFSAWHGWCSSHSSRNSLMGAAPTGNRQRAAVARNAYMLLLRFSSFQLNELFSCSECERKLSDGRTRMDGIVTDGTATSVLGTLLNFQRNIKKIPVVNGVAEQQNIIRTRSNCACVNSIFHSSYRGICNNEFTVPMKPKIWANVESPSKSSLD